MRDFWNKSVGFVLMVATCFALLVGAKYVFSDRFSPRTLGLTGLLHETDIGCLFIGSSHTRQSYDVALLQERTGESAYLVSYNGLGPFLMEPLMRFIADNGKPRVKTYVL